MRNYDLEFLKKFSMVIGFLMLVTLGLIIAAMFVHSQIPAEINPDVAKRTEQRIAPVGAVYAGSTGAAAQQAASAAAAAKAASQVAYGGTTDGSVIFNNLCTGCHTSGAGGAPTMDKAHWAQRLPKGKEERQVLAERIGADGHILLDALYAEDAQSWLIQIPAVQTLRRVWVQEFYRTDAGIHWRTEEQGLPPSARLVGSPYDTEARYAIPPQELT